VGWGATAGARPVRVDARTVARAAIALPAAAAAAYIVARCGYEAAAAPTQREAANHLALGLAAGAPAIVALVAWRASARAATVALPAAALIAGCVAFQGILASGSFFAGDDWLHLVKAHDAALTAPYLADPVFIHYAPGLRFGYWALQHVAPADWGVALAGLLVLFAGSLVLFHRICIQLFGERRSNLVVLLLFGSSVTLVTSFVWFADGLHKLPSTFLSLLAIHAWLRHRETSSRAALALSVAAVSLGLLFYVKVILVPLYLVLIEVLLLKRRTNLWSLAAFAPPIALYLWNYAAGYAALAGDKPELGLVAEYVWTAWYRGAAPALTGVYVGLDERALATVAAIAVQIAIVAVVWHRRTAWRAWAFAAIAFVANASLVGLGRLESFGFERVAWDPRYHTELAWLLPLALAFAFKNVELRRRRAAAAAIAVYVIFATVTGTLIALWWQDTQSATSTEYVANLPRHGELLDQPVPAFLVSARDHPWDRLERLAPAVGAARVVASSDDPRIVGEDGVARPARLYPAGSTLPGLEGCARGTLAIPGGQPSLYAQLDLGRERMLVSLAEPLRLTLPRGARVCVRQTAVGWLGPA
jgi:hypothetical protein